MNNKKRTELVEKRSANVKVFENADHSRTAEIYLDAVHFQDEDGSWKEMDDSLAEEDCEDENNDNSGGKEKEFSNKKGKFQFKMKKHSKEKGMFTLKKGDAQIRWGLKGAAKITAVKEDGEKVRYKDILKGTDLVCMIRGEKVKEDIILASPETDNEFTYIYEMKDLTPVQQKEAVAFMDADGKTVFYVSAPYMIDAAGVKSEAVKVLLSDADKKGKGCCITFIPDKDWLSAPERVYPVVIDPVTTSSKECDDIMDAHVDSLYEENNFQQSFILKTRGGNYIQRSFVKFLLPEMKTGDMVVNARLVLASFATDSKTRSIAVHKVLNSWDSGTINWNNKPIYEEIIQDICRYKADKAKFITFDITRMVKDWYQNGDNNGLMFKDEHEILDNYTEYQASDNHDDFEGQRPRVEISYMNYSGIEDYWTYHTQDIGRAGMVYVNDYNGNLILIHDTLTMSGNGMPINLSHVYNTNYMTEDIGYGYGFRLNYHQTLVSKTIAGTKYYRYVDGNGTVHYFFKDTDNIWKDEAITDRILTINTDGTYTIKDKKNNKFIFNHDGFLVTIMDNSGQTLSIMYNFANTIDQIVDECLRITSFTYTTGSDGITRLSKVTAPDGSKKVFTYSATGMLTKIIDIDNEQLTYSYEDKRLVKVTNLDGYNVKYEYYMSSVPYRVKKITEYAGTIEGKSLSIEYGHNSTKYSDNKKRAEIYRFNNMGNLIHIHDGFGHAASARYNVSGNHVNCLENATKLQDNIIQLFKNPAMLNGSNDWTPVLSADGVGENSVNTDTSYCMIGSNSLKSYCNTVDGHAYWSQNVKLKLGETYTASMYVKAVIDTAGSKGAMLRVRYKDSSGANKYFDSECLKTSTDGWVRLHVTFTMPEDASSETVKFYMTMYKAAGTMYGDLAQFEVGDTPSRVNLIDNGALHLGKVTDYTNDNDAEDVLTKVGTSERVNFTHHLVTVNDSVVMYGDATADSSNTVATLAKGTHVSGFATVVEKLDGGSTKTWYHVINESGKIGYIVSSNLAAYVSSGDTLTNGVVAAVGPELMASASSSGTYVKWDIPQHCPIVVISNKEDSNGKTWYRVGLTIDNTRYIGYLPTEAVARFYTKEYNGTLSAADSLYSRPSTSGSVLKSYTANESVVLKGYVIDASGTTWYAVQNGAVFGYLHSRYVTCSETPAINKRNREEVMEGVNGLDDKIFKFYGRSDVNKKLTKTLDMAGAKGDTYIVNAWGKGTPLPETDNDKDRRFGVEVVFISSGGSRDVHYTNFSADLLDWQFLSDVYVAKHAYTKVEVSYTYCHQANTAYFDGLSLFREEFGQTYTYDEDNNIISVVDNQKNRQEFEYDDKNDMTGVTDAKGNDFTYTYDNKHRVTQGISAEGIRYEFEYQNDTGNVIKSGIVDPLNENNGIWLTRTMTDDDNHLASVIDGEGHKVEYGWNLEKDTMTSMTDAKGNVFNYEYDAMNRLKKVTLSVKINGAATTPISNLYTYTKDNLTSITHNGFVYGFTYDGFGNTVAASIAGNQVVSYEYEAGNEKLLKTIYENGAYIRYTYDEQDRVVNTFYRDNENDIESKLNSYVYDKQGNLVKVTNHVSGKKYSLTYDFLDRLMRVRDEDGNIYEYTYDVDNHMSSMKHTTATGSKENGYTYDKDGRETVTALGSNGRYTTYDAFGRMTFQQWANSNDVFFASTTYGYPSNGNNLSARPNFMRIGSRDLNYTYDANGNILSVTDSAGKYTASYQYDERNQLIRENNKSIEKTFVYTYDIGGNLTSIKEYAYTTDTLGSVVKTTVGVYASTSGWKDQLTSWDGNTLTYDDIGNMLSNGRGMTFTWTQGRKLTSCVKNGTTSQYQYDHTGLRVKKTVGTIVTKYCYAGRLLLSETTGTTTIYYHYDSAGNLIAVTIGGVMYFYVKNLAGDIIGLIDGSGNTVVEYTYDSWGNPSTPTGSLASTVGKQNPFRYKGYYYDDETELYYLTDRYYDPSIRRFINPDKIYSVQETMETLDNRNLYLYCNNNPITRKDETGDAWHVAAISFVVGAATSVACQLTFEGTVNWKKVLCDGASMTCSVLGVNPFIAVIPDIIDACWASKEASADGAEVLNKSLKNAAVQIACDFWLPNPLDLAVGDYRRYVNSYRENVTKYMKNRCYDNIDVKKLIANEKTKLTIKTGAKIGYDVTKSVGKSSYKPTKKSNASQTKDDLVYMIPSPKKRKEFMSFAGQRVIVG